MKFAGQGVSLARKYHHARIRSDETPLEYLYRLNVAAIRAKISIREGTSDARREHVEHFIETLDDRVLAKQLALLRLTDLMTWRKLCMPTSERRLGRVKRPWDRAISDHDRASLPIRHRPNRPGLYEQSGKKKVEVADRMQSQVNQTWMQIDNAFA